MQQKIVPIGEVHQSDSQLREVDKGSAKFEGMVASMRENGILNPISVRYVDNKETGEQDLVLIDGAHRLASATEAGIQEIPVTILELDDVQALSAQINANIHTVQTKPYQYSRQLNRMLALNENLTVDDLARMTGETKEWVNTRLNLHKLNENAGKKVDEGVIPIMSAIALAKLPQEDHDEFAEKAMMAETSEAFIEEVQAVIKARRAEKANEAGDGVDPVEKAVETARCRKVGEIKNAYESADDFLGAIVDDNMTPKEAGMAVLNWIMQMDDASKEQRRAAAIERQEAEKARREKSRAQSTAKKVEKAEANLEKLKAQLEKEGVAPASE